MPHLCSPVWMWWGEVQHDSLWLCNLAVACVVSPSLQEPHNQLNLSLIDSWTQGSTAVFFSGPCWIDCSLGLTVSADTATCFLSLSQSLSLLFCRIFFFFAIAEILFFGLETFIVLVWSPWYRQASLVAQMIKNLPAVPGDVASIPGSGRSPGERNDNPLQYSCLENSMDRGALWATIHGVAKSQTRLSD